MRDYRVHFCAFSDNLSANSCILVDVRAICKPFFNDLRNNSQYSFLSNKLFFEYEKLYFLIVKRSQFKLFYIVRNFDLLGTLRDHDGGGNEDEEKQEI